MYCITYIYRVSPLLVVQYMASDVRLYSKTQIWKVLDRWMDDCKMWDGSWTGGHTAAAHPRLNWHQILASLLQTGVTHPTVCTEPPHVLQRKIWTLGPRCHRRRIGVSEVIGATQSLFPSQVQYISETGEDIENRCGCIFLFNNIWWSFCEHPELSCTHVLWGSVHLAVDKL